MPGKIRYKEFIENYFLIKSKEGKIVPFIFNPTQQLYYQQLQKDYPGLVGVRDNILKARREGFSSFWEAIFTVDFIMGTIGNGPIISGQIVSHKLEEVKSHFQRVDMFLNSYLDKNKVSRKVFLEVDNKTSYIKSRMGTELFVGSAGAKVLGRGGDTQNLLWTEIAFYPNTPIINAEDLVIGAEQQVPMGKGKIVRESTGNVVGDFFYEEWNRGDKKESPFISRFFPWYYHKEYRVPCPPAFEFSPSERETREAYHLDSSQLYWYHLKMKGFKDKNKGHREYPNCVVADTRISSHGGISRIGDNGKYYKGKNKVFKLVTSLGYSIETTAEHKFFTESNRWVKLKRLQKGDKVCLLKPTFNKKYQWVELDLGLPILKQKLKIDEEFAEFIGIFMGDGSVCKPPGTSVYVLSMVFDKRDRDTANKVEKKMEKMFGRKIGTRLTGTKRGCLELRVASKYFGELFTSLELIERRNRGIKRKVHVPSYILNSPKSVVAAFLRGLFDADGFIAYPYPRVGFFSKYKQFIKDIQLLLLGFGITSRYSEREASLNEYRYVARELALRKAETRRFMRKIGFISKRKNSRWENRKATNKTKRIIRNSKGQFIKGRGMDWNSLKIKLVDVIVSIEKTGLKKVYDMEVRPEHYYSANGLWIHNSVMDCFLSGGACFFDLPTLRWYLGKVKKPIQKGYLAPDGQFI